MSALTIGSLFSGIGGLELGLERAGLGPVVWQVEREPYCRAVLAKHWPNATRYDDVCTVGAHNLTPVDVICGGFPCQDISVAGKGAGIDGARSGLWTEYARLVRELRPRYVVVENVPALLVRGFDRVLGDLAACGYDAEWDCVPAASVGAPHLRDRVFVVAYPNRDGLWLESVAVRGGFCPPVAHVDGGPRSMANADGSTRRSETRSADTGVGCAAVRLGAQESGRRSRDVAHADGRDGEGLVARRHDENLWRIARTRPSGLRSGAGEHPGWAVEPDVGRVAHGVPARVDRLRALGNAVVPQVAEVVGRLIVAREQARAEVAA